MTTLSLAQQVKRCILMCCNRNSTQRLRITCQGQHVQRSMAGLLASIYTEVRCTNEQLKFYVLRHKPLAQLLICPWAVGDCCFSLKMLKSPHKEIYSFKLTMPFRSVSFSCERGLRIQGGGYMTCGWTGVCRMVFRKLPSSIYRLLPSYPLL